MTASLPRLEPKNIQSWRSWLENNHTRQKGVWLVYYKQLTGKRAFSYAAAVEEAICFGWIDSLPGKIDEERAMLKFTPRKPKAVWSEINKQRVYRLIKEKKMTASGLKVIQLAKDNGSWHSLTLSDQHAKNNTVPPDLEKALNKNKIAKSVFFAFPPSCRKQFLSWIDGAKKEETRKARIEKTVMMSAAKRKPGINGFK